MLKHNSLCASQQDKLQPSNRPPDNGWRCPLPRARFGSRDRRPDLSLRLLRSREPRRPRPPRPPRPTYSSSQDGLFHLIWPSQQKDGPRACEEPQKTPCQLLEVLSCDPHPRPRRGNGRRSHRPWRFGAWRAVGETGSGCRDEHA